MKKSSIDLARHLKSANRSKGAAHRLHSGADDNMSIRSRSELMATLALLCVTASLPATKEDIVRFQSEVSRGQDFREPLGHNLLFTLKSTGDGWRISVEPSKVVEPACSDYAWVVNMPIRNSNALDLFPSYGDTAQNIVDKSPFEFNFVLELRRLQA